MEIPTIEDLISMNKKIKRKLTPMFVESKCLFKDGRERTIKARPIGMPYVVQVGIIENPTNHPKAKERPYLLKFDCKPKQLNKQEAKIVLGTDCFIETCPEDMYGMLEACVSGPGIANAYVLGFSVGFSELGPNHVAIPIQYYKISSKDHKSLALTAEEITRARRRLRI